MLVSQEVISKQDAILMMGLGTWRLRPMMAPAFEALGAQLEGGWRHLPLGSLHIEALPKVSPFHSLTSQLTGAMGYLPVGPSECSNGPACMNLLVCPLPMMLSGCAAVESNKSHCDTLVTWAGI